jgi:hypothetical protein
MTSESSFASAVEVVEGLASCQHLDRLVTPLSTFAVMPKGPTVIFRLIHLELSFSLTDGTELSTLALWGLMGRGGFPARKSLSLESPGWRWGEKVEPTLSAAFRGVADTLQALTLTRKDRRRTVRRRGG